MEFSLENPATSAISVKLLLAGGHEYNISLHPNDPLLAELMAAITANSQAEESPASIFQIPLNSGNSSLCFSGKHLIGVVTEPALYFQLDSVEDEREIASEVGIAETIETIPSHAAQIDHFLTPSEHQDLLSYVLEQQPAFLPTTTSTGDEAYRQSLILHTFPKFSNLITKRIRAILPDVFRRLEMPSFSIVQIEAQLTAHNDGNYYKIHNDNGSPDTARRELTYVYYFYREPQPFLGGELRIYDSRIENGFYIGADSYQTIQPRNNSIVFFLSRYLHEVLPVECPSRSFADSRFTVNGWIQK
jgi:Rps23 Pro-64 3,4-dihydroxylase Tpa1-like proline 4-hydroxylase